MRVTYDREADAVYLLIQPGVRVARSEQVDPGTLVDLDRFGRPVGIEVLSPGRRWPTVQLSQRYELEPSVLYQLEYLGGNAKGATLAFPDKVMLVGC